jgi:hypothetical protein
LGVSGLILGCSGPFLAGLGCFLGFEQGLCELLEGVKEGGPMCVDGCRGRGR